MIYMSFDAEAFKRTYHEQLLREVVHVLTDILNADEGGEATPEFVRAKEKALELLIKVTNGTNKL